VYQHLLETTPFVRGYEDEATGLEVFRSSFHQPAKAFFVALPDVTARV
jgi:hypothetical protein